MSTDPSAAARARAALDAAARAPGDPGPWVALAGALSAMGQDPRAAWAEAAARAPTGPGGLELARALLQAGQGALAATVLDRVAAAPRPPPGADAALVRLWAERGELLRAEGAARRWAARRPDPDAALAHAHALTRLAHAPRARAALGPALRGPPAARVEAAALLVALTFRADARAALAGVPAATPGRREVEALLAAADGDDAAAWAALEAARRAGEALRVEAVALWARLAGGYGAAARAAESVEAALPARAPADRRLLLHALGDAWERAGDPGAAWAAHLRANAEARPAWSPAALDRELGAIGALADLPLPADRPPSPRVALLVGLPRSGTSLLEQMLAAHPGVSPLGENPYLRDALAGLSAAGGPPWTGALADPAARARARAAWLGQLGGDPGRLRTEKAPLNLLFVDAAARLVDGLRVVLCRRDLLDTSVSCLFQSFGPYYAFTDHPAWMGHAARSLSALMDRWRDRPPCAVHELVHERLLDDPEGELRRLLAFLDLPWDPAVLEFHTLDREVHTASTAQVRQPLHRRAVGRGRRYLPWAGELVRALEGAPPPG
jgi:hypothetical protein